ncbi:MAG: histidine--tRNA ligase [Endomicrobium sp.]|jgi:histidyl-tRNA synthetase|nr:histidine--tRNA ligase [Endomicrobium sp.]
MILYKAPRGTHDILGADVVFINFLERYAREVFIKHGFEEIRTPIFENADLFIRAIGEITDIVEKEMYIFTDKKGRTLSLRPEGTASIVRAFIEHRQDIMKSISKFFYIGEMFRYEKPQAGRYRQFHQIGVEYFGNENPTADAELILLAKNILSYIGIHNINININSLGCKTCRPFFKKKLIQYFHTVKNNLCSDCIKRLYKNPFRVLDCKIDSNKFLGSPKLINYLCDHCKIHFDTLQRLLKSVKCKYYINNQLVRGIDYYTKTIFEIYAKDETTGLQNVIAAGGRYDNLVSELSYNKYNIPAVGFAFGVERILILAKTIGILHNKTLVPPEKIFIAVTDKILFKNAFSCYATLSQMICQNNPKIVLFPPIISNNLNDQLRFANKMGITKTIIFAQREYDNKQIIIKNMRTRSQTKIFIDDISQILINSI